MFADKPSGIQQFFMLSGKWLCSSDIYDSSPSLVGRVA
jgi:hypothetical protein